MSKKSQRKTNETAPKTSHCGPWGTLMNIPSLLLIDDDFDTVGNVVDELKIERNIDRD